MPSNYFQPGGGGGGTVSSVFGRTGAVTATTGDYSVGQLSAIAAYTAVANNTASSANPSAVSFLTLGTPGFALTAGTSFSQFTLTTASVAQLTIQNLSANASASTDFVATADTGNDTTRYINVGINSSLGGAAPFTAAYDTYVYTTEAALKIGALGTSGAVTIHTGGGTATPTLAATFSATNLTVVGTIAASNLSLASTFTTSGANALTLTTTGATNVTLPATGTLAALGGTNTWSATQTFSAGCNAAQNYFSSYGGAASKSAFWSNQAPFAGGTATTCFPQFYAAAQSSPTTWATGTNKGTCFGCAPAATFTGNIFDFYVGTTQQAMLTYQGNLTLAGSVTTGTPNGGTSAAWKMGTVVSPGSLTLNTTNYIQLDVAGTLYKLATVN